MSPTVTLATSEGRPGRRRLPRDQRAHQLVDVAEALFAAHGIQATSVEEVAERAGVTKPVVYDHFGSKDGLVAAVVRRTGVEISEAVLGAVERAADPEHALAAGLRAYFQIMHDRRNGWSSLLTETAAMSTAAAAALEQVRDQHAELIAALVSSDVPGCDLARARMYAQIVIGASERLATRRTPSGAVPTVTALTRHMMDVLWCGFGAVRDGERWVS